MKVSHLGDKVLLEDFICTTKVFPKWQIQITCDVLVRDNPL